MNFFSLIAIIILFTACSGNSGAANQLYGSDSLVINFTAQPSDSLIKSVTTADEKAITKIIRFVNAKRSEEYKCGYNGSLLFFSKGKLLGNVSFNYAEEGCSHFLISLNGNLTSTKMSNEAANFLKSLAEGKQWY